MLCSLVSFDLMCYTYFFISANLIKEYYVAYVLQYAPDGRMAY